MSIDHGSRLKKIIKNSDIKVADIVRKTDIARGSIYYLMNKKELLRSEVSQILEVLDFDIDSFFNQDFPKDIQSQQALKRENELLRDTIAHQKEIIKMLKKGKK